MTEQQLQDFDKALLSCLRKIFNLNNNTTKRTFFMMKKQGGLGVRKPSIMYRATCLNFLVKMINHSDENFRYIARNSLHLDFNKRGIPRTEGESNFLRYAINENGLLDTHIKGGFGVQSDWPQLVTLVEKINAELKWERCSEDLNDAGHAQIILRSATGSKIVTHKSIRKELIKELLNKELCNIKELPMQGHLIDNEKADYLSSQNIFHNHKITDELMQFWYKARRNVLPCYYTLSLWYPNQSATCALDGYKTESTSHILKGCKKVKHNYTKRQD